MRAGSSQLRFGLVDDGRTHTLEEIGSDFGVTRERIRQIEEKALRKLRHRICRWQFQLGLLADFIRSGGSLLLPDSSFTPWHRLLFLVSGLNFTPIETLGTSVLTTDDISEYYSYLLNDDNYHRQFQPALLPFFVPSRCRPPASGRRRILEPSRQVLDASAHDP